jgi:hypothetical protein
MTPVSDKKYNKALDMLDKAAQLINMMLEYANCEHDVGICYCKDRVLLEHICDLLEDHQKTKGDTICLRPAVY